MEDSDDDYDELRVYVDSWTVLAQARKADMSLVQESTECASERASLKAKPIYSARELIQIVGRTSKAEPESASYAASDFALNEARDDGRSSGPGYLRSGCVAHL